MSDGTIRGLDGRDRPARAVVRYRSRAYRLNLGAIERAYMQGVVEGRYQTRDDLARAAGVSRSTLGRFYTGRATSMRTTLSVLRELGLDFDRVARPCR